MLFSKPDSRNHQVLAIAAVNDQKATQRAQLFAKVTAEEVEIMAREKARERSFDVNTEKNGLLRAMLHVISNKELMSQVAKRSKERLERLSRWNQNSL